MDLSLNTVVTQRFLVYACIDLLPEQLDVVLVSNPFKISIRSMQFSKTENTINITLAPAQDSSQQTERSLCGRCLAWCGCCRCAIFAIVVAVIVALAIFLPLRIDKVQYVHTIQFVFYFYVSITFSVNAIHFLLPYAWYDFLVSRLLHRCIPPIVFPCLLPLPRPPPLTPTPPPPPPPPHPPPPPPPTSSSFSSSSLLTSSSSLLILPSVIIRLIIIILLLLCPHHPPQHLLVLWVFLHVDIPRPHPSVSTTTGTGLY